MTGAAPPDRLPLTVTATRSHLPHAATMLQSLQESTPDRAFHVHLLHGGDVTDADLDPVRRTLAPSGSTLQDHAVPQPVQARLPAPQLHVSAWFRVLLPDLVPDLDRIVHIDVDAVVVDDVSPLWGVDLDGAWLAAAVNALYPFQPPYYRTHLGLDEPSEYLNSGVMVMDLAAMRADGMVEQVLDYAADHPDNLWNDQDALAVVARGRWRRLHPRWNCQSTLYEVDANQLDLDPDEVEEALRRPAIVHFIGPFKPWTHGCQHPLRHLWRQARARTPYGPHVPQRTKRDVVYRPLRAPARARLTQVEVVVRRALARLRGR